MYLKLIIVLCIAAINYIANAEYKERIITTCKVAKTARVQINSNFSKEEQEQTLFNVNEKESGRETYVLSEITNVSTEEERRAFFSSRFYNITYRGSLNTWSILDIFKDTKSKLAAEIVILNESNPFILKIVYPSMEEVIFWFNIDGNGDGTMSMVGTRWKSFLNKNSNQSLTYAECKSNR